MYLLVLQGLEICYIQMGDASCIIYISTDKSLRNREKSWRATGLNAGVIFVVVGATKGEYVSTVKGTQLTTMYLNNP